MNKEYTLGYFLHFKHVKEAYELLKKQIEEKSPLYNTLEFTVFRKEDKLKTFNPETFYENFIKNDTFYHFQNKVFLVDYLGVQSAYKIRKYHFLSFEALIIYTAIGLYLHEVLNQYQTDFDKILHKSDGKIFYGGKVNHKEGSKSTVFYYKDYKEFLEYKEKLTQPEKGVTKYVITVDIRSFFYTINHKKLLKIINDNATNVTKKALKYNENTISSIEFFLKYLMKGNLGIPVSSQNLISSFLSSIYFSPFDQYLIDKYLGDNSISYIRYVDDFYLIYQVDETKDISFARNLIYDIENDISDFLSNELNLSVSSEKSQRSKIDNEDSYYNFLSLSSATSPNEIAFYEYVTFQIKDLAQEKGVEGKSVQEIFTDCMSIIHNIKNQLLSLDKINVTKEDSNFLNNLLINPKVRDYCKSQKALNLLKEQELFNNYNSLDYILAKLKVFLHLISLTKENREYFHKILISESNINRNINQKLMLIERFILQLEFLSYGDKEEKIIKMTEIDYYKEEYKKIVRRFIEYQPQNFYAKLILKMFDEKEELMDFKTLYSSDMLNLYENSSLMQQVKQRHLNEKLNYLNVAFNHLLNEFQNLVELTFFDRKQKDALAIQDKLIEEKLSVSEILFVSDFFKRRNQNSISHANDPELGFWAVSEAEYYEYKRKIERLIDKILKKYHAK